MIDLSSAQMIVTFEDHSGSKEKVIQPKELKRFINVEHDQDTKILSINLPMEKTKLISLSFQFAQKLSADSRLLLNGYQSWTDTRLFSLQENISPMLEPAFSQYAFYGDYNFYSDFQKDSVLRSHSWVTIQNKEQSLFIGSLTDFEAFSLFLFSKHGNLEIRRDFSGANWPGGAFTALRLFISEKSTHDAFKAYAKSLGFKSAGYPAAGYTSWYHLYNRISEKSILNDLKKFRKAEIPLDFFQIDDGFQESIGNWTETNEKFPSGLADLAYNIKSAGYQAGLWLAPFLCQGEGWLQKKSPDFLINGKDDKPIQMGINPGWGGAFFALDLFNEKVLNYLEETFRIILFDYKFDLLKLDFLFAACAFPRPGFTRATQMRRAMEFIRSWATFEKKIIGCGVPLISTGGIVDYCRIGADVEFRWETEDLKVCNYRERVSNENAILNSIYRSMLSGGFFSNDPDVFILRDVIDTQERKPMLLSEDQKLTLFLVNQVCGDLLFTSDPLDEIPDQFINLYLSSFPVFKKEILGIHEFKKVLEISFRVEKRNFLLLVNLNSEPVSVTLPKGSLFDRIQCCLEEGGNQRKLPSYGSALYHLCKPDSPFLGSSSHLFCGSELESIKVDKSELFMDFKETCKFRDKTWVRSDKRLTHNSLLSNYPAQDKEKKFYVII